MKTLPDCGFYYGLQRYCCYKAAVAMAPFSDSFAIKLSAWRYENNLLIKQKANPKVSLYKK
jgi:hypothetical protein